MLTLNVLPGPPPGRTEPARVTTSWEDDAGHPYAWAGISADGHWIEWEGVGSFRFSPPRRVVTAWPAECASADTVRTVFTRFLQPVVLQAFGHPVLHASGVLGPTGAIAFCGLSGAGKSTFAFGLARDGYRQFADDAVVLSLPGTTVTVHPLPFSSRLRPPALEALGPSPATDRAAGAADAPAELQAIVILAQDATLESPARALRIPAHRAFTRVLTHAHSFDPDNPVEAARLSRDYLDLVTRVPVVEFTYRPDFSRFEEVLSRALRSTPLGETFDERESPVPSTRTP